MAANEVPHLSGYLPPAGCARCEPRPSAGRSLGQLGVVAGQQPLHLVDVQRLGRKPLPPDGGQQLFGPGWALREQFDGAGPDVRPAGRRLRAPALGHASADEGPRPKLPALGTRATRCLGRPGSRRLRSAGPDRRPRPASPSPSRRASLALGEFSSSEGRPRPSGRSTNRPARRRPRPADVWAAAPSAAKRRTRSATVADVSPFNSPD